MTNNKPRTLTVPDAGCPNVSLEMFAEHTGHIAVAAEDSYGEIDVLLGHEGARRLRDWLTGYLGDEDDTDKTPDDDGWEDADWQGDNPPRPGDEVEFAVKSDGGVTHFSRGIFYHLNEDTGVRTRENGHLGYVDSNLGTWRVRRAPEPDPADVLTPGTILRDMIASDDTRAKVGEVNGSAESVIAAWDHSTTAVEVGDLVAFTVESTGDRWEKQDGRWTITSAEGIRDALNGDEA